MALAVQPHPTDGASRDEIEKLEQKVLRHRNQLKSGIFNVELVHSFLRDGGNETTNRLIRVWLSDSSIRGDFTRQYPGDSPLAGKTYRDVASIHGGVLRHYSDVQFDGGGTMATEILPLKGTHANTYTVPNPRLVGMSSSSFLNLVHASMYDCVGKASSAPEATLTPEDYEGERVQRVSFHLPENVAASIWFSDEKASVACIELEGQGVRERVECRHSAIKGYGWYPSQAVYRRWENGKLVEEETAKIQAEQINKPLENSVFDFSGMDLPVGTYITDRTSKSHRHLRITSGGLEEVNDEVQVADVATPSNGSAKTALLLINGLLFLALVIYIIIRRGSSPSASPPAS